MKKENYKLINAVNDYKRLLEGKSKKYTPYDIQIIYEVLKRFITTDHTVYTTFIENVAKFFEKHNFNVFADDDRINYMIVYEQ